MTQSATIPTSDVQEVALAYGRRGWVPVPIPSGRKAPTHKGSRSWSRVQSVGNEA